MAVLFGSFSIKAICTTLAISFLFDIAMETLIVLTLVHATLALPSARDFYFDRFQILANEDAMFYGSDLVLNSEETYANSVLMSRKYAELDAAFQVIMAL